jgi:hypothetical protein
MFIPTLIINHSNLSSNINKVSSGDIILIKDTLTITELELLIDQISFRNLKIVPLSELINEKNIN